VDVLYVLHKPVVEKKHGSCLLLLGHAIWKIHVKILKHTALHVDGSNPIPVSTCAE
jgi:hypothetical protein